MTVSDLKNVSAEELFSEATKFKNSGDLARAEATLRSGVEQFGEARDQYGHPLFRKGLIRLLLSTGHWDKAESFAKATSTSQNETWYERLFARAYTEAGNVPLAALWWARILSEKPNDVEARNWFLHVLLQQPVWPSDPNDGAGLRKLMQFADSEWTQGRREAARRVLLEAAERYPNFSDYGPGNAFIRKLAHRAILSQDQEFLLALIDSNPPHLMEMFEGMDAILRLNTKNLGDIQRYFHHKALELSANSLADTSKVAKAAVAVNNIGLAQQAAFILRKQAASPRSSNPDASFTANILSGDAALCSGDADAAGAYYKKASDIQPESVRALLGSAAAMLDQGRLGDCANYVEKAISAPMPPNIPMLLEATKYFAHSVRRSPEKTSPASIDLLIFSHATEKMKNNQQIAPPRTDMIAGILKDAARRASTDIRFTATVMYDHRDTDLSKNYLRNLEDLTRNTGTHLVVNTRNGLRRQWIDGISRSTAEFLLIIEQDHAFLPHCPDWQSLINLFRKRPDINYIRLNRRDNVPIILDFSASQTRRDQQDGITRAPMFSNTPHLMHRSFYTSIVYPIIMDNAKMDTDNGGAAGVEENVNRAFERIVHFLGWPIMTRLFGMAIWGNLGDAAVMRNLGF